MKQRRVYRIRGDMQLERRKDKCHVRYICEKEAVFLDVKVVRKEDCGIVTDLYVKPTDRTRYLHKDSEHPRHVKEGIAKGQARRLRQI